LPYFGERLKDVKLLKNMLIAIISDTHGNNATFAKFAAWAKQNKVREVIHCGDIGFAYFAKEMTELLPEAHFSLVIGNLDNDKDSIEKMVAPGQSPNTSFYGKTGEMEIDHKKIAFTHKPDDARKLAATGRFNLVFFGHTHQPWEEKVGFCRLINPGNLAGEIYQSTFAVYDTKTGYLELKITDRP